MPLVEDSTRNDLTYRITGAAMAVHNSLGRGFPEEMYEKTLLVELEKRGISARRQVPVEIEYGEDSVGLFYLDLLVEEKVIVELKAFPHLLTDEDTAQVINYLLATELDVALLINFGRVRLDHHRIFPPRDRAASPRQIARFMVRKTIHPDKNP